LHSALEVQTAPSSIFWASSLQKPPSSQEVHASATSDLQHRLFLQGVSEQPALLLQASPGTGVVVEVCDVVVDTVVVVLLTVVVVVVIATP